MEDSSTPSETPRPVTENSSDGSSVIVFVVPVSTVGALLMFITIAVLLIVLLKWHCKLQCNCFPNLLAECEFHWRIGSTHKSRGQEEKCDGWRTLLMVSLFKAQLVIDWSQTTTWRTTHCMR